MLCSKVMYLSSENPSKNMQFHRNCWHLLCRYGWQDGRCALFEFKLGNREIEKGAFHSVSLTCRNVAGITRCHLIFLQKRTGQRFCPALIPVVQKSALREFVKG